MNWEALKAKLDADEKKLKYQIYLHLFGIFLWCVSLGLCIYWFSWKLALIITLFQWCNNISLREPEV